MTYVVDEAETRSTSVDIPSPEVAPTEVADKGGENEAAGKDEGTVPAVLPPHDLVLAEIADVRNTRLATRLDEHPTDVREEEALVRVVRVQGRVGVAVVRAVTAGPPFDRTLDRTSTSNRKEVLEGLRGVVRTVGPEAVVACGNACQHRMQG